MSAPEFFTLTELQRDLADIENGDAAETPEWLKRALMSAWQAGMMAGDLSAYSGGLHRAQNPFMTEAEKIAWYGR